MTYVIYRRIKKFILVELITQRYGILIYVWCLFMISLFYNDISE